MEAVTVGQSTPATAILPPAKTVRRSSATTS